MGENYRWQQVLQGINYVLHKSEGFICAVLIAVVTTMTCWQVVSRYILYIPSSWVDETARYLYVWSAYIGGAYLGYGTKEHIYIDIVTMFYKNKPNASKIDATFDRITALCLLIFGGFFSKIYLDFLVTYITYPSSSPALNINILYPMSGVAVGMILLTFHSVCILLVPKSLRDAGWPWHEISSRERGIER